MTSDTVLVLDFERTGLETRAQDGLLKVDSIRTNVSARLVTAVLMG